MAGSITVIGGNNGDTLTGLVSIADAGFSAPIITALQTLLNTSVGGATSGLSDSVLGGKEFLNNVNVSTLSGAVVIGSNGSSVPGLLEISNTDSNGGTTTSSVSISLTVPSNYNTLIVQAPGDETISGNGSAGMLDIFGAQSDVTYTDTGSGTVFAAGNANLLLSGGVWSAVGGSLGNVDVNTDAASAYVTLSGAGNATGDNTISSNAIGSYSPKLSVLSTGTRDFILTGADGNGDGADAVTVTGFANIRDIGASDTVVATGTGTFSGSFGSQGGKIFFINQGSGASSIIGGLDSLTGTITSPGSVSVQAGAGGGVYDGGTNGSNSLSGGSGLVTLFAAGQSNYLFADGSGSGANLLNAFSASNDTLIGGVTSKNNVFFAGTGTESIISHGTGAQTFFVGNFGSETISGSTASTASNVYIFNQFASQGGGTDVIQNFVPGVSKGFINPNDSITGVHIQGFEALAGSNTGTEIDLNDGTTIKLFGVSSSSFNASIVGGTTF